MSPSKEASFDAKHPSDVIGNWGPRQRQVILVLAAAYLAAPFSNSVIPLYAPKQNFTCSLYDNVTGTLVTADNACEIRSPSDGGLVRCSNFSFDRTFYKRTLVSEFNLVCSRAWYASFSQSLHQMGYAVSGLLLGFVSDRLGRRFAGRASMMLEVVAGLGQAFAPNIGLFCLARFFIGVAAYGRFLSGYVLITEWIGPKFRARTSVMMEFAGFGSYFVLLFFFYHVPDYRVVQTSASLFGIFLSILYFFLVEESPRWLMTHGKHEEAEVLLTRAAKARARLTDIEIKRRIQSLIENAEQEVSQESQKQTVIHLWREPVLLKLSLILFFTWFTHAFIGYASTFNAENLGAGLFAGMTILSIAGCVEVSISSFLIQRLPRRQAMFWLMLLESFALLCLLISTARQEWVVCRMIASVGLQITTGLVFCFYYLYTAESFPTTMRQAGMGACSVFARIGSVVAPFVKELTNMTHLSVPVSIFLSLALVNTLLIRFVPETKDLQMTDTIEQKKKEVEATRDHRLSIDLPSV